jgi:hypothetical protein
MHLPSTRNSPVVPRLCSASSTAAITNSWNRFDEARLLSLRSAGRSPRDNGWMCARGRRTSATRPGGFTRDGPHASLGGGFPEAVVPSRLELVALRGAVPCAGRMTVSALVWWVIPIAITAIAIAVVGLRSRIGDPRSDPMTDRARLRAAMERPIPGSSNPRGSRDPAAQ